MFLKKLQYKYIFKANFRQYYPLNFSNLLFIDNIWEYKIKNYFLKVIKHYLRFINLKNYLNKTI
jgi:hypothetical protein